MGNGNELLCAARKALAAEMGNAIFCDDIVHIIFAGCDNRAFGQAGFDLADCTALRGGFKGNKALTSPALAGSADVIDLAAGAREMPAADGLGADLTPEIYLDGSVDRDHIVVSADDIRIVHIVNGENHDRRVIIDIIINPLGTKCKGCHGFKGMDLLFAVVDSATFDQLHHGISKHFGMNTEVVLGFEGHAGRIRNSTDAELDAGTVRNLLGNQIADGNACLIQFHGRQDRQRMGILHNGIHLADVKLCVAY